jgi:predicted nucleotidyltransferase
MANFHSDEWIMNRIQEHYEEAKEYFDENRIVGIFCQGSQNYGLDYENSDIDTKLIVVPTFEEIAFNKKPHSTTHVRANNEHIDFKDIRLYIETFRKQNLNFLEILFTPYKIVNPQYAEWWNRLVENREAIAHYDIHRAIKSMKGIAMEKYHAMEHRYPTKIDIIDKYGYDSKQLHHLLRVEEYLRRYINEESYENCLIPSDFLSKKLRAIKENNGLLTLDEARAAADTSLLAIERMCEMGLEKYPEDQDEKVEKLFKKVQYEIMRFAIAVELMEDEYYD